MTTEEQRLPVLAFPGLSPDSLGNYLASLGLLRTLARKWPSTRIAWRDGVLQVVGGPPTLDALLDELVRVATKREWTPYDRAWSDAQKKGTKAKSGEPLVLWQGKASEQYLEMFAAHAVPHARVSFNPLLGSGGNAGRRDFAAGWKKATDALATTNTPKKSKPNTKKNTLTESTPEKVGDERRSELHALLLGLPVSWLIQELGAGSWFSEATKVYNSGQRPSREGQLCPWAMALACEGLALLAGGASRRLGSRSRAVGAFPFVTQAAAPDAAGEAGLILGEIWVPLWDRPMTIAEARTLFARGRAELGGRGALTPAAFASAIAARGVDAGVSEFRRFTLGRTTSANTFEPRFEARFPLTVGAEVTNASTVTVLERITALIEQRGFPRDRKVGQRWRVTGIRGPLEAALLGVAAEPHRPDMAITLLDAVAAALDRIDRNRSFRKEQVRWKPLPLEWLPLVFSTDPPATEARLALSLTSAFPPSQPFATYRFGVEWKYGRYEHAERPPARWVWGPGELARVLGAVLARRLLDEAAAAGDGPGRSAGRAPMPATCDHVSQWLNGDVDEPLLHVWLSRLALFDWRTIPQEVCSLIPTDGAHRVFDGDLALIGLFQPLVDQRPLVAPSLSWNDLLAADTGARTRAAARSLINLIRAGNIEAAVRLASSRYAMAGGRLASIDAAWSVREPDRLLAALLLTIPDRDRAVLFERWLRPRRRQPGVEAHV